MILAAWLAACGEDDSPAGNTPDASVHDVVFPFDVEPKDATMEPAPDASRPSCRGIKEAENVRCDDFDQDDPDLTKRGWNLAPPDDGGISQVLPRIIQDDSAASPPRVLEAVAEPTDAGLPRSVITDVVAVTKTSSTLEADVFVAEWSQGAYRVLRFDFGPTPQDLTGVTLDVLADGKWRCVGYGTQALSNKVLKLGAWHHVKLVMVTEGSNLRGSCEVDDVRTAPIPGQLSTSTNRRLEIGVTTYSSTTPRTRVLYDNVDFHAE